MKLVLSVSAIGEQAEGRCPWMWIDLSPPLAQRALERIDVFRFAEEKDDDVIELYYVSLEVTFFNPWLAAPETEQEAEPVLGGFAEGSEKVGRVRFAGHREVRRDQK